eukprot:1186754-Prorocentrum_minimum.AAC.9
MRGVDPPASTVISPTGVGIVDVGGKVREAVYSTVGTASGATATGIIATSTSTLNLDLSF